MEITERDDGVLELRPTVPVPADPAWFWTERWQRREHEVDQYISAGSVTSYESTEDFLTGLDNASTDSAS